MHRREPHLRPVADDEEDEAGRETQPGKGDGRHRGRAGREQVVPGHADGGEQAPEDPDDIRRSRTELGSA